MKIQDPQSASAGLPPDAPADAPTGPADGHGPAEFSARRPRSWRAFAIKLAASLLLIGYIVSRADLGAVATALLTVSPGWVAAAIGLQLLGPALISRRWEGLLAARNVTPGWLYLYGSTLVSGFFRQFMPSTIGGDVIRGYDAWRAGAPVGVALMSLLLDRLFGLIALALLAMGGVMLSDRLNERLPAIGLYVLVALVVLVAAMAQLVRPTPFSLRLGRAALNLSPAALRGRLDKIAAALGSYRDAKGVLVSSLLLSLALQVNVITFYWVLGRALDLPVDYASFFVIAPIAIFVMMLPISINGIGVREGIFVFLLAQWGIDSAHAIALAWLEFGIFLSFGLLGGLLYVLRR